MNIWVIIPAYNEEKLLAQILDVIKQKGLSTLVIDDGSKDGTLTIARQLATHVIQNETNLGKGAALHKGIDYLLTSEKVDYIITMDADGQHSLDDLDSFVAAAKSGEYFVVGNRMSNPQGMPLVRILTNQLMSWLISLIANQKIPDSQCGFRLFNVEVLRKISICSRKYEIESELLVKASWAGFKIKSIFIRSVYLQNQISKINPLIDTLRFIKFLFSLVCGKK